MVLVWLALAASVVAVIAATTVTTFRGIELFRAFRAVGADIGDELTSIERRTGEIEGHLSAAARSGEALSAATARLAVSRARLNVLLAALADVRAAATRITAVVPRK